MMDPIPAMPVSPAPAVDASNNARDPKGCEDARGFGNQLKQEIAARSGDASEAPAEASAATDAPVEEKTETAVDAPVALDPAVAALLADATTVQQPVAIAVPVPVVQQPVAVTAEAAPAEETAAEIAVSDTKPAGVQRAAADGVAEQAQEKRGIERGRERFERAGAERVSAERGTERAAIERSAVDRGAIERGAFDRASAERALAPELREFRPARDAAERNFVIQDKAGAETAAAALPQGFTVDRGATGVDAPLPVAAAASALDSLSASGLAARWAAPAAAGGTDVPAAAVTARVDTPLGAPGWGDAFQQKVVWMVDHHLEGAELHINPPHLGPVDVMLNLTGDGAQIAFSSPHAAVREAIESSLPDLRNALDARGVSLGQASVGTDSGAAREQFAEQAREAARNAQNGRSGGSGGGVLEAPTPARAAISRRGLVDTFA